MMARRSKGGSRIALAVANPAPSARALCKITSSATAPANCWKSDQFAAKAITTKATKIPIDRYCKGVLRRLVRSGRFMFNKTPKHNGSTSITLTVIITDTGSIDVARKISRVGA